METVLRILMVEDSEDDAILTLHQIKKGGYDIEYERIETADEMKTLLREKPWDIILSDYKMPHFDGMEALSILKESGRDIPFIIISGTIGEDIAVEAMRTGAQDYIMKNNVHRLLPAIERELRESKNRAERKQLELKQRQAEEDRKAHIHFLESLKQIDQVIKQETGVEQMLWHIIKTVFLIFDCDRAWLLYPCDPDAPSFRVPVEISKPEYPGANMLNVDIPMSPGDAKNLREALESDAPVTDIAGTEKPVFTARQFGVLSQIFIPIHPKLGKPWGFGMHQCSYPRVWTLEDKRLFQEIGRRLAEGLTSLLMLRELKKSEERFRRLAENARDVIYRMSVPEGKYEYVSPASLPIFGYSPEECYKTPIIIRQAIHPDWHQYFEEQWANLIKGIMPPTYEYQFIHKSGEVRWLNQRNILLRDDSGNPIAIEGIVTDITERKKAEEKLSKSAKEWAETFDAMSDGVSIQSDEFVIVSVNKTLAEILNMSKEEIIGQKCYQLIHCKSDPIGDCPLAACKITKQDEYVETFEPVLGKWIAISTSPILDEQGNIQKIIHTVRDITELKNAEEQMQLHQANMAHLLRLGEVGEMASALAHEINQPLCAIENYAGACLRLMETNPDTQQLSDIIVKICTQVERTGKIIHHIKGMFKKKPPQFEFIDINDVIQEAVELMEIKARNQVIHKRMNIQQGLPLVYADFILIEQVIINLISNALDAMNNPKICTKELTIGAKTVLNDMIEVSVSDTGCGILPEDMKKIFGSFFTTKENGIGMGLSLSRTIIESHSGQIWATANVTGGTTFHVTLPTRNFKNEKL
jgi:PAS domain S-box-containing protein